MGTITLTLPTSHFFKTQGNLFLPIVADLAVYTVFRKVRDFRVSEIAGAIAGLAVGFCLYDRASPLITLTGAGLYLAYKVIHYMNVSLDTSPLSDEEQLEIAFYKLKEKVTITADNVVEVSSEGFEQVCDFVEITPDIISQIRRKWNDPDILRETEDLMFRAYKVIRNELREAEEKILDLTSDQDRTNSKIVENLGKTFYTAFEIFFETYRHVHNMCYRIQLPNLQNGDESGSWREFSIDTTEEDKNLFVLGVNPKFKMKQLYSYVNDLLRPLFEHFPKEIDLEAWKKELTPEYSFSSDSDESIDDGAHVEGEVDRPKKPHLNGLEVPEAD